MTSPATDRLEVLVLVAMGVDAPRARAIVEHHLVVGTHLPDTLLRDPTG